MDANEVWAPQACTPPTAQRPLRLAEFDALFAEAAIGVERIDEGRMRVGLLAEPAAAERAAGLAARETGCCSLLTLTLTATGGALAMDVTVPAPHTGVLAALTDRAANVVTTARQAGRTSPRERA